MRGRRAAARPPHAEYGLEPWQALWYDPRLDLAIREPPKDPPPASVAARELAWATRTRGGGDGAPVKYAPRHGAPAAEAATDAPPREGAPAENPSSLALEDVLAQLGARFPSARERSRLFVYHSALDLAVERRLVSAGVGCLGDPDEHALLGSLQQAKGWLHPQLSRTPLAAYLPTSACAAPLHDGGAPPPARQPGAGAALGCIDDALAAGLLGTARRAGDDGRACGAGCSVRAPRGYICASAAEEHVAYAALKGWTPAAPIADAADWAAAASGAGPLFPAPGGALGGGGARTRIVLKPTDGLGCRGLVLDAQPQHLRPLVRAPACPPKAAGSMIVEEMVGELGGPSPTVYMVGSKVVAVADQVRRGGSARASPARARTS